MDSQSIEMQAVAYTLYELLLPKDTQKISPEDFCAKYEANQKAFQACCSGCARILNSLKNRDERK